MIGRIVLRLLVFVFLAGVVVSSSCTPLGGKIDESISQNHYYGLLRTSVVFSYGGNCLGPGCTAVRGAQVGSFRPLDPFHAVDDERAYFESRPIEGESPEGFRALGGPYSKGTRGAYYRGVLLPADPKTFEVVRFEGGVVAEQYARDRSSVFCREQILSRDPAGFRPLERKNYFRDGTGVYFISGGVCHRFPSDPERFEFLSNPDGSPAIYARDGVHVFTVPGTRRVSGADAATFTPICEKTVVRAYAIDRARVYEFGREIPGADPRTFVFPEACALPEGWGEPAVDPEDSP